MVRSKVCWTRWATRTIQFSSPRRLPNSRRVHWKDRLKASALTYHLTRGQFTIVAPIHGSPAEEAGILAGDVVLAVDGNDIIDMPEWEVITMIRGPSDTIVTLTVVHPDTGESIDIEIERGRIDIESVLWSRIAGTDLVHLQISQFAGDTSTELKNALRRNWPRRTRANPSQVSCWIFVTIRAATYKKRCAWQASFYRKAISSCMKGMRKEKTTTYRSQGSGMARDHPACCAGEPWFSQCGRNCGRRLARKRTR